MALTKPEIVAAVENLYADHLKPFGRVLLKRLRERAAARHAAAHGLSADAVDPEEMPRLNPRHLRKMCETCRQLRVVSEEGREFSVTLASEPCDFLDVCSPVDPYPEEFWQEFALLLKTAEEGMQLPGGRYACARALLSKHFPCLNLFSLGQICHIVQLAINSRRLLGYNREGWLVAYEQSEGWLKEQCASAQAATGQEVHPVVSWEEARMFLRQLLHSHHQAGSGGITLSNMKRLFRMHFERELSETALGHVRLLDLMKDVRLSDVCALSVQGNGQTTVQAAEPLQLCPAIPPGMWAIPVTMCPTPMLNLVPLPLHMEVGVPEVLLSPGASPRGSPAGGFSFASESTREGSLECARSMPSLPSLPVHADYGALEELASPGSSPRGSLCGAHSFATESTAEGTPDSVSESDEADAMALPFHMQCDDEDELWSVSVKNTFLDVTLTDCEPASPSSRQRRRSTPAISRARVVY